MPDELASTRLSQRLGAELNHLRRMARIGGRRMAEATGLSQSSVSRIESGRRRPSRTEIDVWLSLTDADEHAADRIQALLKAVHAESMTWSDLLADTGSLQGQVAAREHTARAVRSWSPDEVPGLLQTRDYANALMPLVAAPEADVAMTVDGRIQRQRILYQPGREFVFLTTEHALTRPVGSAQVMDAQRSHVRQQATIEGVTVDIVPEPWPLLAASAFVFYETEDDDAFVTLELTHGPLMLSEPGVVSQYRAVFDLLHSHAHPVR